jgi:sterol 3beta-glucosyltransferase
MKFGLYNYGTRGDLQPFISLAIALKKRGHDVSVLCISPYPYDFSNYKRDFDLDIQSVLDADFYQKNLVKLNELDKDPKAVARYFAYLHYCAHVGMRKLAETSDVVIAAAGAYEVHGYTELYGKKMVNLCLQYHLIPSSTRKPKYIKEEKDVAQSWRDIEEHYSWQHERTNHFRSHIGLPPLENAYRHTSFSSVLNLVTISKVFCDRLSDGWSDKFKVCGYFPHQLATGTAPAPVGMAEFIAKGEAPIFFSMGSAAHFDKAPMTRFELVIAAARAIGRRLIIQCTNGEEIGHLCGDADDIFVIKGEINHQTVMPHCALIIHHGGTGTTHAACMSGRPSLVLHYWGDMPDWAEDMQALGVAGETIYAMDVTSEWLVDQMTKVLNDTAMAYRAKLVGEQMRAEDPLAEAVDILEQAFMPSSQPTAAIAEES